MIDAENSPLRKDEELFDAYKNGDNEALGEIYDRYVGLIYCRSLYWTYGMFQNAEDLTSNIFFSVLRKANTFRNRGNGSLLAWVGTMTSNEGKNWRRNQSRSSAHIDYRFVLESKDRDGGEHNKNDHPMSIIPDEKSISPVDRVVINEEIREIQRIITSPSFSPREQLVLLLRFKEELSGAQMAARLECSEGAAKVLLHRTLKKIKNKIKLDGESSVFETELKYNETKKAGRACNLNK